MNIQEFITERQAAVDRYKARVSSEAETIENTAFREVILITVLNAFQDGFDAGILIADQKHNAQTKATQL